MKGTSEKYFWEDRRRLKLFIQIVLRVNINFGDFFFSNLLVLLL